MSPFDQAIIYGFIGGVAFVAVLLLGLHIANNEAPLRADEADAPFRPTENENLRTVRVCRECHRYTGPDRKLLAGQHLSVIPTLCPICAKRAVACSSSAHA